MSLKPFGLCFSIYVEPMQTRQGWCLSTSLLDCVTVRLGALHRLEHGWTFDEYEIRAELRHGVVSMASSRSAVAAGRGRAALACANRVALDRLVCFDRCACPTNVAIRHRWQSAEVGGWCRSRVVALSSFRTME